MKSRLFSLAIFLLQVVIYANPTYGAVIPTQAAKESQVLTHFEYIEPEESYVTVPNLIKGKHGPIILEGAFERLLPETLMWHVDLAEESYNFHLEKNNDVISNDLKITVDDNEHSSFTLSRCYYVGSLIDDEGRKFGWARFTLLSDRFDDLMDGQPIFEGTFYDSKHSKLYGVVRHGNFFKKVAHGQISTSSSAQLILFNYANLKAHKKMDPRSNRRSNCDLDHNHAEKAKVRLQSLDTMPANLYKVTTETELEYLGCPSSKRVIYISIVSDCTFTANYDNVEDLKTAVISLIHQASQPYEEQLNVTLSLRELTILSKCNNSGFNQPCQSSYSFSKKLKDFSFWQSERSPSTEIIAASQLLTECKSGSVIGLAWINELCDAGYRTPSGTIVGGTSVVSSHGLLQWSTVAHELGHTFGAIHDCNSNIHDSPATCCQCVGSDCGGGFIMDPMNVGQTMFSPCSRKTICGLLNQKKCLFTPEVLSRFSTNS